MRSNRKSFEEYKIEFDTVITAKAIEETRRPNVRGKEDKKMKKKCRKIV